MKNKQVRQMMKDTPCALDTIVSGKVVSIGGLGGELFLLKVALGKSLLKLLTDNGGSIPWEDYHKVQDTLVTTLETYNEI